MNRVSIATLVVSLLAASTAFAAYDVPKDEPQFLQCKAYSLTKYQGGDEASPIPGQNKADAFCSCMWHETPENFKGSLAKFSETDAGAKTNAMCEKHSGWQS